MSTLSKMLTLLRSGARELGESVLSRHPSAVLEQECLDARARLQEARRELAGLMAQEQALARQAEGLRAQLQQQEALAVQALRQQRPDLAEPLAARVTALEAELEQHQALQAEHQAQRGQLAALVQQAEAQLRDQERGLQMARTTESVHRATASIASQLEARDAPRARDTLRALREKSALLSDHVAAQQALQTEVTALDQQLAAAGIGPDAERRHRVLERLRRQADAS